MEREVLRERHDLRKTILAKLDEKYRRVSFAHLPTPLIFCPRLSEETGVEVWMKRDDLTGIALGGNKSRHLEYVLAEALAAKANVVVFGAAVQSNYARQLTAACAQLGLKVYLILTTYYGQSRGQGNVLLDKLFGAAIEYVNVPLNSMGPFKFAARAQLLEKGHRPYVIEPPSSEVLGAASYLRAAVELDEQLESIGLEPKSIFLAAAGPTQAGLVAGKKALNWDLSVVGVAPHAHQGKKTDFPHIDKNEAETQRSSS
ncbi:pyridoxal-phosphate dependent enzyme, partial [Alicyclobacillus tolerans]|uniref:pyridoxal-phosphate dependent enzyme n=1 Tax=Alicyclobacillus tolerans TaxID=90970 RepID=UPI001F343291